MMVKKLRAVLCSTPEFGEEEGHAPTGSEMSDCAPDPEQGDVGGPLTALQLHQLLHDVHDYGLMDTKKNRLLMYVFLVLIYIGLNIALLCANFEPQDFIEENYFVSFHMAGFWGLFMFTLLEALLLIAADMVSWSNRLQSVLILFNVMMSFATAMLISLDVSVFEVPAHYMEFSVQVLISSINIVFVQSYIRSADPQNLVYRLRHVELMVALFILGLSILQLVIYSGLVPTSMGPERAAHFCGFANEIFNGIFALIYAMFLYLNARKQLQRHYKNMKALKV